MRRLLARLLCSEVFREAEGYHRIKSLLDEARWWLGKQHPEAASLAQHILDGDQLYWTSSEPTRRPEWTWQAPRWVSTIDTYRRWLESGPFRVSTDHPDRAGPQDERA